MPSIIDAEETEKRLKKMQADIHRVVASMRAMDDFTLWRFVKSLAYKASQHPQISAVPFDYAAHFVIEHLDTPTAPPPSPPASAPPGGAPRG